MKIINNNHNNNYNGINKTCQCEEQNQFNN